MCVCVYVCIRGCGCGCVYVSAWKVAHIVAGTGISFVYTVCVFVCIVLSCVSTGSHRDCELVSVCLSVGTHWVYASPALCRWTRVCVCAHLEVLP